jgi:hypothetical protein
MFRIILTIISALEDSNLGDESNSSREIEIKTPRLKKLSSEVKAVTTRKNRHSVLTQNNIDNIPVNEESARKIKNTAEYFCQISLLIPQTQKFCSSLVASACVVAARKT